MRHPALGVASTVVCCALLLFPTYSGWDTWRFWASVGSFAFGLPAIFSATKDNRLLNSLGNLSYPVYIVHIFVIVLLENAGFSEYVLALAGPSGVVGLEMGITLGAAVAAHWLLEMPTAVAMRFVLAWMASRIRSQALEPTDILVSQQVMPLEKPP